MNKNNILVGIMIVGVMLGLQQLGWIDLTRIIPDDPTPDVTPDPVPIPNPLPNPTPDPIPDPTPDPVPEPEPAPPIDIIVDFPEVPEGFEDRTKDIYTAFIGCGKKDAALAFAQAYKDWSETLLSDASKKIDSGEKVRYVNVEIIKWLLKENDLDKSFCPGLGVAIEKGLVETLNLEKTFDDEDRLNTSNLFKAISAQSYKAYKELK